MLDTITDARIGRPSCDEAIQARHRNERATDNLLKLLIERHPNAPEWSKYSSRQIAEPIIPPPVPVQENPAPPQQAEWLSMQDVAATPIVPTRKYPRIEEIQRAASKHYGVAVLDLLSSRRTANVVRPRQVAMYLAKTLTLRSLPEIGRRFGGRDHTTVLHAVRKIANLVMLDTELAANVDAIRREIGI